MLLDGWGEDGARLYRDPVDIVQASRLDEVRSILLAFVSAHGASQSFATRNSAYRRASGEPGSGRQS